MQDSAGDALFEPILRREESLVSSEDQSYAESGSLGNIVGDQRKPVMKEGKRGVNALQLTMIVYFFTSGGPFGIEPVVGAGGPLLTLVALVVIPLLWSFPQALMASELSLMMSENGGNVIWVQRAFGDFLGFVNAYNNIIQSIFSSSLLSILFVQYLQLTIPFYVTLSMQFGFVFIITIINILGLRWVSRLSVLFLILVYSPFVAEAVIIVYRGDLDLRSLETVPPYSQIQWANFLSTAIWALDGMDAMGSLAGEVKGGRKAFLTGVIGSLPLIFSNYFFPIFFGYSVAQDYTQWSSGYFTVIASSIHKRSIFLEFG